jgi:tRNA G18 (ribose-2'-O)-methylase SpoU
LASSAAASAVRIAAAGWTWSESLAAQPKPVASARMLHVQVDSFDDPRLDTFRNLKRQPARTDGTFVAESELVLARLFESSIAVRAVLLTPARAERLGPQLATHLGRQNADATTVFVATQAIIDEVVGYPLNRGVIAVAQRPVLPPVSSLLTSARTIIVMERVMDPENVGSVFRHAAGFGVDAVLLHGPTGDPLYRKAIRISMGWSLAIPYAKVAPGLDVNTLLSDADFVTLALTPARDAELLTTVVGSLDSSARVAFLVGAEGPGLLPQTLASADHRVRIPLAAEVDSLNVAAALAIALHSLTTAQPARLERR